MKIGNQIYKPKLRITMFKLREKLELGVKGWEQAMMFTYPLVSSEREIYKVFFTDSHNSSGNSKALEEIYAILN